MCEDGIIEGGSFVDSDSSAAPLVTIPHLDAQILATGSSHRVKWVDNIDAKVWVSGQWVPILVPRIRPGRRRLCWPSSVGQCVVNGSFF